MRSLRRVLKKIKKLKFKRIIPILLLILFVPVLTFSLYNIAYSSKIFPNISVAGFPLSGLSQESASQILTEEFQIPDEIKIVNQNQVFTLNPKDLEVFIDTKTSSQNAYSLGRTGNITVDMLKRLDLLIHPENISLKVNIDSEKLSKFVSVVAGQDSVEAVDPSITIVGGKVKVSEGSAGSEIDQEALKNLIIDSLARGKTAEISIPLIITDNSLSEIEAEAVKIRAEKYLGKSLQIKFEFDSFVIKDVEILKLLDLKGGFNEQMVSKKTDEFAQKIERNPQNPKFTFDNGRVTEFQPALDGVKMDKAAFGQNLLSSLSSLEEGADKVIVLDIPVLRAPPEISTDSVNNLGIKELIGRGTSTYFHSIPSRVHNVVLATSRINGTLVAPGETFSFNNALGDVSSFTGYQQAYIISDGKTILGDGGGVCQVSTTLFRSLLNAGLPISERTSHAYRVGYYEQNSPPGLDATVYGPSPDLKFINDTANHILIEAKADPKHYSLVFELYGTSDGRVAVVSKPVVSNISPPPEDLYQDDPTLASGKVKQIDFKASGAKVVFNYTVSRGGEQIYKKTFVSNYRPWQAIYLRGTGI